VYNLTFNQSKEKIMKNSKFFEELRKKDGGFIDSLSLCGPLGGLLLIAFVIKKYFDYVTSKTQNNEKLEHNAPTVKN